ncbi:hypothetical protein [Candidatus Pelagibacter sp. HIMB1636]|uniref:hypothetical protein n=1 Tax=Candidatus Pelagibacter sp. HIMB1636 TaxID=3413360 RepID=UPI003F84418A
MKFRLTKKDGLDYAKKSGDFNSIHLNSLVGYNSSFGSEICHGTLIIIKSLKLLKINKILKNKKNFNLNFNFKNFFVYNENTYINIRKNVIFQKNAGLIEFSLKSKNISAGKFLNYSKKKIIKHSSNSKNNHFDNLCDILNIVSRYVGMIYPGKYSLLNSININFNYESKNINREIFILSKKNKRFPIIENKLTYKNYEINFLSLERPRLVVKNEEISKVFKNKIKKINEPILIIGASSGIGNELLKIFELNKKIKILATFYRNKIKIKNKNTKLFKINVEKDEMKLKKILNKFPIIRIFYMATPRINIKNNTQENFKKFKFFYNDLPLKILKFYPKKIIKFFYPASIYSEKIKSHYSKSKLIAEKNLKKLKKDNIKINILKIPEVNTKHNLSIINNKLPSFTKLLNKNKNFQRKILFL